MPNLVALRSNRYVIWLILALPGLWLVCPFLAEGRIPSRFLVESGEWSVRLLILTMALTPLQRLFRTSRLVFWLARRRRYFGVACFFYAALHVVYYLWETFLDWGPGALTWILLTASNLYAWSGWLALAIFVPLALTSNNSSLRWLGRWWKWLQRLTYFAALATAVHWLLIAPTWLTWAQIGALLLLEVIRIAQLLRNRRAQARR